MPSEPPAEQQPDPVDPEETVDAVPVIVSEVRALEPVRRQLPAVQVAAAAATGIAVGAVAVVALQRHAARKPAGPRRVARRKRGGGSETLTVAGTRSFLLDVHLLNRE